MRQYLLLIRLPNVFTTPSDIMAGYFATVEPTGIDIGNLALLMVSSALLYIAGIIINDYFDIEIDRRERPFRPLPSGNVSKRSAITIALSALAIANAIAFAIGSASFIISLILSATIIAYDYWLKHSAAGPFAMGGTRFLNIILGASPAISAIAATQLTGAFTQLEIAMFAAASLLVYVVAITLLSKKEVQNEKPSLNSFLIVFAITASVGIIGLKLLGLQWAFLLNLSIFAAIMIVTFKKYIATDTPSIQKAIRNMVISIIILDSVFVCGTAGLPYGLTTLLFIIPAVMLAKKLYVT